LTGQRRRPELQEGKNDTGQDIEEALCYSFRVVGSSFFYRGKKLEIQLESRGLHPVFYQSIRVWNDMTADKELHNWKITHRIVIPETKEILVGYNAGKSTVSFAVIPMERRRRYHNGNLLEEGNGRPCCDPHADQ